MKSRKRAFFAFFLAGGFLLAAAPEAEAQVAVGLSGSVTGMEVTTWGLGARVGAAVYEANGHTVAIEGVGEYLWPSCDVVDCSAFGVQGNVLYRHHVASYAEAYFGVGLVWLDYTLEDDEGGYENDGDDLGFSLIGGTQAGQPGGIRPFLEVRFSFMDELDNQAGVALGLRLPIS